MDKQKCTGCGKSIGTGIASGMCVYCSVNGQIRGEGAALAAAEARIAELLAREHREAERRTKQGVILDHAMRGLRHSAEHPDDGRMQAVRALAQHSARQAGRIAALENALEPFAREHYDLSILSPSEERSFDAQDLRRAAALLKEKD